MGDTYKLRGVQSIICFIFGGRFSLGQLLVIWSTLWAFFRCRLRSIEFGSHLVPRSEGRSASTVVKSSKLKGHLRQRLRVPETEEVARRNKQVLCLNRQTVYGDSESPDLALV